MSVSTSFTYDELVAALQRWAEDAGTEFVTEIPVIIANGESRLASDLDLEIFDEIVTTQSLTPGQREQALKGSEWQGTRTIHLRDVGGTGPLRYLRRRTYEFCVDYEPDPAVTAEPIYYAEITPTEWYFVDTPDQAYALEFRQRRPPDPLTPANQESWLGNNAGDMLLYSSLISADEFLLSDDDIVAKWKSTYAELLPARRYALRKLARADYGPITPAQQR